MTTRERRQELEAIAARSRCAVCHTQARVAWLPTGETWRLPTHEYRLRCNCYPQAPTLEKLPPSELSKAIADPEYPVDAVTRMQAERFREKRGISDSSAPLASTVCPREAGDDTARLVQADSAKRNLS